MNFYFEKSSHEIYSEVFILTHEDEAAESERLNSDKVIK